MDPRSGRIIKALAIALVSTLFFGSSVGFVAAGSDESKIESYGVAAPKVGDLWQYNITGTITTGAMTQDIHMEYRATWLPARGWQDPTTGQGHVAMVLRQHLIASDDEGMTVFTRDIGIDRTTQALLFSEYDESEAWTFYHRASVPVIGFGGSQTEWNGHVLRSVEDFAPAPFLCGAISPLQGGNVTVEAGLVIPGDCDPFAELGLHGLTVSALAERTIGGHEAVEFEHRSADTHVSVAWTRAIPYPLRIQVEDTRTLESGSASLTQSTDMILELTGYSPGAGLWGGNLRVPADTPLEPIPVQARTRVGGDDEGIEHPWKLQRALDQVRDEPGFPGSIRDYMSDHPDAEILRAKFYEQLDSQTVRFTWEVLLSDGEGAWEGSLEYERQRYPAQELEQVNFHTWRYPGSEVSAAEHPHPGELPATAPSIAAALDRYVAREGALEATAFYGAAYSCDESCEFYVFAGETTRDVRQPNPALAGAFTGVHKYIVLDSNGRLVKASDATERAVAGQGVADLPDDVPPSDGQLYASPAYSSATVWALPDVQTAASVTVLGVLLGALYWGWPFLKTLPGLRLFSRIRPDDLLEHPVRRDIMEFIQEHPGSHYQALVRHVGKGRGVIEHHVRKMEAGGLLTSTRSDGYMCLYEKGTVDRAVMGAMPALKAATAANILDAIVAAPGITAQELAGRIGVTPSTVSYHVRRLRDARLLDQVQHQKTQCLVPTAIAKETLALRMT